jgi:hypothetical protein
VSEQREGELSFARRARCAAEVRLQRAERERSKAPPWKARAPLHRQIPRSPPQDAHLRRKVGATKAKADPSSQKALCRDDRLTARARQPQCRDEGKSDRRNQRPIGPHALRTLRVKMRPLHRQRQKQIQRQRQQRQKPHPLGCKGGAPGTANAGASRCAWIEISGWRSFLRALRIGAVRLKRVSTPGLALCRLCGRLGKLGRGKWGSGLGAGSSWGLWRCHADLGAGQWCRC